MELRKAATLRPSPKVNILLRAKRLPLVPKIVLFEDRITTRRHRKLLKENRDTTLSARKYQTQRLVNRYLQREEPECYGIEQMRECMRHRFEEKSVSQFL